MSTLALNTSLARLEQAKETSNRLAKAARSDWPDISEIWQYCVKPFILDENIFYWRFSFPRTSRKDESNLFAGANVDSYYRQWMDLTKVLAYQDPIMRYSIHGGFDPHESQKANILFNFAENVGNMLFMITLAECTDDELRDDMSNFAERFNAEKAHAVAPLLQALPRYDLYVDLETSVYTNVPSHPSLANAARYAAEQLGLIWL